MTGVINQLAHIVQTVALADQPIDQVNLVVESISTNMSVDVCSLYLANARGEMLLLASHGEWMGSAAIDSATRRRLFAEVQDPALGAEVRALCEAVMLCDSHLADGETELLDDMARAWPMPLNPTHRTSSMEQLAA